MKTARGNKKLHSLCVFSVFALLVGFGQGVARANLITNGSFETGGNFTSYDNVAVSDNITMAGWTVVGQPGRTNPITWIYSGNFGLTAQDGNYFLDLTGFQDGPPYGGVSQTISTSAGNSYSLSFYLGSSSYWGLPDGIDVFIDGSLLPLASFTSTLTGTNNWEQETTSFTAAGPLTTISLIGNSGIAYIGLDNVDVELTGIASVPGSVVGCGPSWPDDAQRRPLYLVATTAESHLNDSGAAQVRNIIETVNLACRVGKGERFARAVPTRFATPIHPRGHGAARHSRARAFAHPTTHASPAR
jgi:hypothetical protein